MTGQFSGEVSSTLDEGTTAELGEFAIDCVCAYVCMCCYFLKLNVPQDYSKIQPHLIRN